MIKRKINSPEEGKIIANARASSYYEELGRLLNRYDPEQFGNVIANLIFAFLENGPKAWKYFPIHFAINSIEVNCAYHKSYRREVLTKERIKKIANFYNSYYDPYLEFTIEDQKNPFLPFVALAKQQLKLQQKPNKKDFARSLILFVNDNPLPRIGQSFLAAKGYSLLDWVKMCFSIQAKTGINNPVFRIENFLDSEVTAIPQKAVAPFLNEASKTTPEIGEIYRKTRFSLPPSLYIFIPSIFFSFPLIKYKDGNFLLPHPYMIFHYGTEGLYQVCRDLDPPIFLEEFTKNFEKYVRTVLLEIPGRIDLFNESQIQEVSPGRSCDYLLNLTDCILLVECKGIRYSSRMKTEKAVEGDNSTGKIADAYDQIVLTAQRIANGSLSPLIRDNHKPIIGICVEYGDIDFVNSDWYLRTCIFPRMNLCIEGKAFLPKPLAEMPQTMSISIFEDFVIACKISGESPIEMITTKLKEPYIIIGDWDAYLQKYASESADLLLPLLRETGNQFFNNFIS